MELVIVLGILMPVTLAIVAANVYTFRVSETAQGSTIAIQDAHATIERIRNTSKQGLAQVTTTFPSGAAVAGFANLPAEQVVVTYPSASADPLAITVTVTWLDRNRNMARALSTWVTQR